MQTLQRLKNNFIQQITENKFIILFYVQNENKNKFIQLIRWLVPGLLLRSLRGKGSDGSDVVGILVAVE